MLNVKAGLVALALCFSISTAALAAPKNRVYLGGDFQVNKMSVNDDLILKNDIKKSLNGVNIFLGYRWNEFALELGSTYIQKVNYSGSANNGFTYVSINATQDNYNGYIDGIYYFPLTSRLDAKAILGLGYLVTDMEATVRASSGFLYGTAYDSKTYEKLGVRAGVGLEYYITNNVSASLSYKYQNGNKFYDNMNTFALGAAYHF